MVVVKWEIGDIFVPKKHLLEIYNLHILYIFMYCNIYLLIHLLEILLTVDIIVWNRSDHLFFRSKSFSY